MMFRFLLVFLCLFSYFVHGKEARILSFDGGGAKGVVSLELLKPIQHETSLGLLKDFDLYAGTSTESIIAGLFSPYEREDLKEKLIELIDCIILLLKDNWKKTFLLSHVTSIKTQLLLT